MIHRDFWAVMAFVHDTGGRRGRAVDSTARCPHTECLQASIQRDNTTAIARPLTYMYPLNDRMYNYFSSRISDLLHPPYLSIAFAFSAYLDPASRDLRDVHLGFCLSGIRHTPISEDRGCTATAWLPSSLARCTANQKYLNQLPHLIVYASTLHFASWLSPATHDAPKIQPQGCECERFPVETRLEAS